MHPGKIHFPLPIPFKLCFLSIIVCLLSQSSNPIICIGLLSMGSSVFAKRRQIKLDPSSPCGGAFGIAIIVTGGIMLLTGPTAASTSGCKLNPYYKPVCGSNHQTFGNIDLLNCFNRDRRPGQKLHVLKHSECGGLLCPSYEDLQGPWYSDSPVCANNGFTYGHIHQIRCLKDFIPSLEVVHEGGCLLHEVKALLGRNYIKKACSEPRKEFEKNFICTHSNKTYSNPFQAICNSPRSIEKRGGKCGCPLQKSCEKAKYLTKAIKKSPKVVRAKYAVCGSDRKTYRSRHHLECSRRFNINLHRVHNGLCRKMRNPCPSSLKNDFTSQSPVCGTDGRSYVSYDALLCAAARMHKDLRYFHSGSCIKNF